MDGMRITQRSFIWMKWAWLAWLAIFIFYFFEIIFSAEIKIL